MWSSLSLDVGQKDLMKSIPNDIEGMLRTLAQIYAMQGQRRQVAILARARPLVEQTNYDNWNGGTYWYSLSLRIPISLYAQIEEDREEIEKDICSRIQPLIRGYQNENLDSVIISLEIENDQNWRKNAIRWLDSSGSNSLKKRVRKYKYDVFISHASEDKDSLVRPLAVSLAKEGYRVWYDEFELKIGDGLSKSIDHGLSQSGYGLVVLSPAFFSKNWPRYELDGLIARQMVGEKVILPIWHKTCRDEILKYSPPLADKLALDSATKSIKEMVSELARVLGQ